jgi:hypothetical protein
MTPAPVGPRSVRSELHRRRAGWVVRNRRIVGKGFGRSPGAGVTASGGRSRVRLRCDDVLAAGDESRVGLSIKLCNVDTSDSGEVRLPGSHAVGAKFVEVDE